MNTQERAAYALGVLDNLPDNNKVELWMLSLGNKVTLKEPYLPASIYYGIMYPYYTQDNEFKSTCNIWRAKFQRYRNAENAS